MRRLISHTAALVAIVSLTLTTVSAQNDAATKDRLKRQNRANPTDGSYAGNLDSKTSGHSIRASQLIGMNIQNSQGENVGEIKDIVLDSKSGKVRYAAVTYGGFLGVGDKMFAVPFDAFKCQQNPDDPNDHDDYVMVLSVTQKQLDGAQGFDQDHWPNFADGNFTSELDRRYGIERRSNRQRLRNGRVDVDVNRDGIDVKVDRN